MTAAPWPEQPRVLASYAYVDGWGKEIDAYKNIDLIVDSGAFTAYTTGNTINIANYIAWLKDHHTYITAAFNLDVIGDAAASARNYIRIQEAVGDTIDIVPVWHITSPAAELERISATSDYVAIGGVANLSSKGPKLMPHLVRAHRIARDHGTALHGLGVTGIKTMMGLPWYSVDSNSWAWAARYALLILHGKRGQRVQFNFGRGSFTARQSAMIRAYDGDPARAAAKNFARKGTPTFAEDYHWVRVAAIRSYMVAEQSCGHHGTKVYLAAATDLHQTWDSFNAGPPTFTGILA